MKKVIKGSIRDAILELVPEWKEPMPVREIRAEVGGDLHDVGVAVRELARHGYLVPVGKVVLERNIRVTTYLATGKPHPGYFIRNA